MTMPEGMQKAIMTYRGQQQPGNQATLEGLTQLFGGNREYAAAALRISQDPEYERQAQAAVEKGNWPKEVLDVGLQLKQARQKMQQAPPIGPIGPMGPGQGQGFPGGSPGMSGGPTGMPSMPPGGAQQAIAALKAMMGG